jgi:hypothetical protein
VTAKLSCTPVLAPFNTGQCRNIDSRRCRRCERNNGGDRDEHCGHAEDRLAVGSSEGWNADEASKEVVMVASCRASCCACCNEGCGGEDDGDLHTWRVEQLEDKLQIANPKHSDRRFREDDRLEEYSGEKVAIFVC